MPTENDSEQQDSVDSGTEKGAVTQHAMGKWNMPEVSAPSRAAGLPDRVAEVRGAIPIRGTEYLIRVPANWNGTLISDLDYVSAAESPKHMYLLEHGYALCGTLRRPELSRPSINRPTSLSRMISERQMRCLASP